MRIIRIVLTAVLWFGLAQADTAPEKAFNQPIKLTGTLKLTTASLLSCAASGGLALGTDSSGNVVCASVVAADVSCSNCISLGEIQTVSTDRLLGRDTAGTGNVEQLTVVGGLEFTGSGGIQRSAISGDVTINAGATTSIVKKASEDFALTGDITPAQITGDEDDYDPTGLSTASVLRLSTDASGWTITGLAGGSDGRIITMHNVGSYAFTLIDDSASSSSANRFDLVANKRLTPSSAITLMYDSTQAKWRMIAGPGTPRTEERWFQVGVQFNSVNSNNWNSLTYLPSATTSAMDGNWPAAYQYNAVADAKKIWSNSFWLPTNVDLTAAFDVDLLLRVPQESKTCVGGADAGEVCTTGATCDTGTCVGKSSLWAVMLSCIDTTDSYEWKFNDQANSASTQYVSSDPGGAMTRTVTFANLSKTTCSAGDLLGMMIRRDGDDVSDTAGTVAFVGLKLRYTVIE